MRFHSLFISSVVAVVFITGCASMRGSEQKAVPVTPQKLSADLQTIKSLRPQLVKLDDEIEEFRRQGGWKKRGYFNAEETTEIEALLFRFTTYHTALWEMVESYGGPEAKFSDSDMEVKAHLLSAAAMLLLASHTSYLVTEFADDPVAIRQINEIYYRSDIPFGTYDNARENVTDPDMRKAVLNDQPLYQTLSADPQSRLSQLSESDSAYAPLIDGIPALLAEAESRLDAVASVYPSQFKAERVAGKARLGQHKALYVVRSEVFKDVSRLKSPRAHLIEFSDAQKAQVYDLLQPGDLILTFTAGYMSDVFIPGAFKHGITYIGTPAERQALALSPDALPPDERYQPEVLAKNLQKLKLDDGKDADMIEAVAEGVIFNNVSHIMDTHINRLLVLRPRLSDSERRAFLVGIFSYLGDGYDFRFDFSDATYQVCTEVIYRAIDGRGQIEFTLTERAGHETLSADDVVNYYLAADPPAFDFVLYVEGDPQSKDHRAMVLVGDAGEKRIRALMAEQQKK